MIRNYLGFPRGISGRELASRALEQAMVMGAEMVFIRSAARLEARDDDLLLTLADGKQAHSRAVVIATGVTYRRLRVPGVERLLGAGCSMAPRLPRRSAWKANRPSSSAAQTQPVRLQLTWPASRNA